MYSWTRLKLNLLAQLYEVGGANVCPAANRWISLQLSSLMFKEVVLNRGDVYHYLIWFFFIAILAVVVVCLLTKGNAFMYGFVNDNNIVTKRQTFARCSYTEHVLWDKLFISLSSPSLFSLSLSLYLLVALLLLPLFFIVPSLTISNSLSSPLSYKHHPYSITFLGP